jgi:hypothetical protein
MADIVPTQPLATDSHSNRRIVRLSLVKGQHRWQFRWEPGDEAALINSVAAMARDPNLPFDWYDAAIVCKHIANPHLAAEQNAPQN